MICYNKQRAFTKSVYLSEVFVLTFHSGMNYADHNAMQTFEIGVELDS